MKIEKTVSNLCQTFRRIRKEKKMTYQQIADIAGLHRTTIGLIEREKRMPTIATCLKICKALEVDLVVLLEGAGDE